MRGKLKSIEELMNMPTSTGDHKELCVRDKDTRVPIYIVSDSKKELLGKEHEISDFDPPYYWVCHKSFIRSCFEWLEE